MKLMLIDEIEKLNAKRLSKENIGSITMSLNKNLKIMEQKKPGHDSEEYSAWEERYYEIKHLIEYADALRNAIICGDAEKTEQCLEDFKTAAADFGMIYGGLKAWKAS